MSNQFIPFSDTSPADWHRWCVEGEGRSKVVELLVRHFDLAEYLSQESLPDDVVQWDACGW